MWISLYNVSSEAVRPRQRESECRPNSSAVTRFYDTDIKFGFHREREEREPQAGGLLQDDRLLNYIGGFPDIARNSANIVEAPT